MNRIIKEAYTKVNVGTRSWSTTLNGSLVEPQPLGDEHSCGPYALRYCMLKWGHDVPVVPLSRLTQTTKAFGTHEWKMKRAARLLGSKYVKHHRTSARDAYKTMVDQLNRGRPLILCVDDWEHWIACIHHSPAGFLIMDSGSSTVIRRIDWKTLKKRLRCSKTNVFDKKRYSIASISRPVQPIRKS